MIFTIGFFIFRRQHVKILLHSYFATYYYGWLTTMKIILVQWLKGRGRYSTLQLASRVGITAKRYATPCPINWVVQRRLAPVKKLLQNFSMFHVIAMHNLIVNYNGHFSAHCISLWVCFKTNFTVTKNQPFTRKTSIKCRYTVSGFEPTTFGTWVSSHNH